MDSYIFIWGFSAELSSEGDGLKHLDANEHILWAKLRDSIPFVFEKKGMSNERREGEGRRRSVRDGWIDRRAG